MKKPKIPAWRLPAAVSLIWLTAMAIVLIIFYRYTKYLPLMLSGLVILLPALVYWSLLLFGGDGTKSGTEQAEDGDPGGNAAGSNTVAGDGSAPPADADASVGTNADTPAAAPGRHGLKYRMSTVFSAVRRVACKFGRLCVRLYYSSRIVSIILLSAVALAATHVCFWLMLRRATSVYKLNYVVPVALAVMFVMCIIFEKWCAHVSGANKTAAAQLRNVRTALAMSRLVLVAVAAAAVVKLLGFYELLRWVNIALAIIFVYVTLFLALSLVVRSIRRELFTAPDLSIPVPFSPGHSRELGVLSYLEKNTGITMRSLWSMKLVKKMIPYTVFVSVLLLWLCSGVVQIEAYQQGAVYRFGQLCEQTLGPGMHLTFPWPIDRVVKYDTETVNTLTIGYISSEDTDNTWTGTHGSNEYKLLLGGGNELVSINLRLEYRIADLDTYLRSCSKPEKLLEAKAYELVTDRTIVTDLDSLLSVDRAAFSDSFRSELIESLSDYNTGLELVSVALESIHPPIDIASVYQEIVGAEVKADKYILDAEAEAAVKIAKAEKSYDTAVNAATADSYTKIAAAQADVAEFMASVAADNTYSDSYRYYKYLKAIGSAYGSARLVIVGRDIDSSGIYFGNLTVTP